MQFYFCEFSNANATSFLISSHADATYVLLYCYKDWLLLKLHYNNNNNINILYKFMVCFDMSKFKTTTIN